MSTPQMTQQLTIPSPINLSLFVPSKYDVLAYGAPKTGKTEFAGTWADAGEVLYIDTGRGMLSLKTASIKGRLKNIDRIYRIPLTNYVEGIKQPVGWMMVTTIMKELTDNGSYEDITPQTVVLDELTSTSAMALDDVMWKAHQNVNASVTQPNWGKLRRETIDFIEAGRALKKINFILLAHEQYYKDELSGRTWCLPSVVGKLAAEIGGYFDEVYHLKVEQRAGKHIYVMDTKPTGIINAGSRFDLDTPVPTTFQSVKGSIEKLKLNP